MKQASAPSPDLFESALDVLPVGIAIFGAHHAVVLHNPRFARPLGLLSGRLRQGLADRVALELLGRPPDLLIPDRPLTEVVDAMMGRGNFGGGPATESHARDRKQRDRSEPCARELAGPAGSIIEARSERTPDGRSVTALTNVTEARQAEREMRGAKQESGQLARPCGDETRAGRRHFRPIHCRNRSKHERADNH
jgi:hypothetical protein